MNAQSYHNTDRFDIGGPETGATVMFSQNPDIHPTLRFYRDWPADIDLVTGMEIIHMMGSYGEALNRTRSAEPSAEFAPLIDYARAWLASRA